MKPFKTHLKKRRFCSYTITFILRRIFVVRQKKIAIETIPYRKWTLWRFILILSHWYVNIVFYNDDDINGDAFQYFHSLLWAFILSNLRLISIMQAGFWIIVWKERGICITCWYNLSQVKEYTGFHILTCLLLLLFFGGLGEGILLHCVKLIMKKGYLFRKWHRY